MEIKHVSVTEFHPSWY